MLIPNADRATIEPEKLRDYLLSAFHPIGRFKARFFGTLPRDAKPAAPTVHGQKYTIRAILNGPTGQSATVVSVWFIPARGNVPRFVTAYPGDGP